MGFGGALSGLSAVYPGYQAAENTQADIEKNQAAAKEAQNKLLGQAVLGRALGGIPGAQPMNPSQPMAPPPGQPSVPSQPAPPQGAPPAPPPPSGGPGAPPAGPNPQAPIGEISLQALKDRIMQTTPGVAGHPEVLMAALERAAPLLDRQSKEDLADMRKELVKAQIDARAANVTAQQAGLDARAGARNDRTDRRLDQADNREARLAAQAGVKNDQGWQRLEMQKQDLARKIQESGDKTALGQWRAIVDAQHKRATEIIQSNSQMSGFNDKDRKALLDEQRVAYGDEIAAMREKMGSTTPTGGTTPAGQLPAAKVQGQVPPNAPLVTAPAPAASAPPIAMLKPNTITTFQNGQKWTLGPDGQPKQVP